MTTKSDPDWLKSEEYSKFIKLVVSYLDLSRQSLSHVKNFRKVIEDHLDPESKKLDLNTTPIYLDNIDDRLKPSIQQHLTDHFAVRQQQHHLFSQIQESFLHLHQKFPDIKATTFEKHFRDNNINVYLIPVDPNSIKGLKKIKESPTWNQQKMKYLISLVITDNQKYLDELIVGYRYQTIEEAFEKLDQSGLIIV